MGLSCPSRSILEPHAGVAELADATGLGPVGREPVEVRVLSPASTFPARGVRLAAGQLATDGGSGMSGYTVRRAEDAPDLLGDYPGEMRAMTYVVDAEQVAITYRRMPQHTGGKGA